MVEGGGEEEGGEEEVHTKSMEDQIVSIRFCTFPCSLIICSHMRSNWVSKWRVNFWGMRYSSYRKPFLLSLKVKCFQS